MLFSGADLNLPSDLSMLKFRILHNLHDNQARRYVDRRIDEHKGVLIS